MELRGVVVESLHAHRAHDKAAMADDVEGAARRLVVVLESEKVRDLDGGIVDERILGEDAADKGDDADGIGSCRRRHDQFDVSHDGQRSTARPIGRGGPSRDCLSDGSRLG